MHPSRPTTTPTPFSRVRQCLALATLCLGLAACGGEYRNDPIVAPEITVQPADQSVTAPAAATFSVTATGTAPEYEWQLSTDGGVSFDTVAGAPDAPSLVLTNTTSTQGGQRFRVRISNPAGSVTSNVALLSVNLASAAPLFTTQPMPQAIVVGQSATWTVAVSGTPPPVLQWRLNGADLANGVQASGVCAGAIVAGAAGTTLSVTSVPINCSGAVFSAVASNGLNPDATSNGAPLTVTAASVAPTATLQPADVSAVVGATATFTAAAGGTPTPTVQWQQSTDAGATWASINGATTTSYTTPATVLADSGKLYRAMFTNASGSANSNAATLTVTATPPTAQLDSPQGVAFDPAGNIYIADTFNHTIRKITPTGVVSTLAGLAGTAGSTDGTGSAARFDTPRGIAVDAAGNVYVGDTFNNTIRKIAPAGVVSTLAGLAGSSGGADGTGSAARFGSPQGIALDAAGNLYVADLGVATIRKVTPAGVVTTLAGLPGSPGSTDGIGSAARFRFPASVAVDSGGNVYVADFGNQTIRKVTPAGVVSTLAGLAQVFGSADGTGGAARFAGPKGVAADTSGNVYVGDTGNHTIRRITPTGLVSTLAGAAGTPGNVDGAGSAARFNEPTGLAFDAVGTLYVADSKNNAVRKVTPAGVVTTFAQ